MTDATSWYRPPVSRRTSFLVTVPVVLASSLAAVSSVHAQAATGAATTPAAGTPATTTPATTPADAPSEPAADQAARARSEFLAAVEFFNAGRYLEAIHGFQVAASLIPSADLTYNIARSYERLAETRHEPADYTQAIEHYRRYLRDQVDPPDRAQVEANIAALAERLEAARAANRTLPTTGRVIVSAPQVTGQVFLDDELRGVAGDVDDLTVQAGRHRLRFEGPRIQTFVSDVEVQAGSSARATAEFFTHTQHTAVRHDPVFSWISFGASGASLIGAVILGVVAADLSSQNGAMMMTGQRDVFAEPRTLAAYSDVLLGSAIGFAGLGIVLHILETNAVDTTTVPAAPVANSEHDDGVRAREGNASSAVPTAPATPAATTPAATSPAATPAATPQ